jgi:predicted small lipoprotein YifL/methionine-rich copper-binding protein CopC
MKKQSIILAIVLVVASLLTSCGRMGPVPPPDKTPPSVMSSFPANGSLNVPVNLSGGIAITFSKLMDASTINAQTVALSDGQYNVPGLVTYTEISDVPIAVFTPSSSLNPATRYTVTVDRNVKDAYGIPMNSTYTCFFDTETAPDTTPPSVTVTNPAPGTNGVVVNIDPSVTFSEPVSLATITFTLSAEGGAVPGTLSYSGTTAIFTPSNLLLNNTQYTVSVSAGVKDLAGNAMPNSYSWSFMTGSALDTTPPSVTSTNPAPGTNGVVVNITPSVTFSEPVSSATITFTLSAGGVAVPGTISYSGTTAIFTPSTPLAYTTLYTATVSAGVQDLAGNAMLNPYPWSFTTSAPPDTTPPSVTATTPGDKATGVAVNITPSVTFSELVSSATITFTLSAGGVPVAGYMAYSGMTAIFIPSTPLAYSTLYTATVSAGVQDLTGNAMLNPYSWSFTTSAPPDTTPPSVTAKTPAAGATNVALNIAPSVTFSEAVNPATLTFTVSAGGVPITGNTTYNGTTAIFTPSIWLAYNTQYDASVSAGVQDLAGNPMPTGYFWSFTTGTAADMTAPYVTATTPGDQATGVAVNTAPSVTFSEPVDQATITFTLSAGGVTVPGTMSYSGTTAIFTPASNLRKNTTKYTAQVSAGVRDLAGNSMQNDYVWTFSTGK